jgi:hypothetical protein
VILKPRPLAERMVDPRGRPLSQPRIASRHGQRGFIVNPFSFAAAPTDPDFSSVDLLLHFNEGNGATTFLDSSSQARTVTTHGSAQASNTQVQFGVSAYKSTSGVTDYLTATVASVTLSSMTNWTLEGWVYRNGNNNDYPVTFGSGGSNFYVAFLGTVIYVGDGSTNNISGVSGAPSPTTWTHWACVKNGTTYAIYIGGVSKGTSTTALSTGAQTVINVGARPGTSNALAGYMDDFRYTPNVARYTTGFTPPTAQFPDS